MAITVPPVRGAGDLGHVDDSNTVRQALLDLDTSGSAHYPAKGDVHGFRWDETVGRRLFAWDAVNGREQMIYGDTGWRDVSASLINSWSSGSTFALRRIDNLVLATFHLVSPAGASSDSLYVVPAGFQPTYFSRLPGLHTGNALVPVAVNGGDMQASRSAIGANTLSCAVSWATSQSWPAALPGTASGAIPTGFVMESAELLPAEES